MAAVYKRILAATTGSGGAGRRLRRSVVQVKAASTAQAANPTTAAGGRNGLLKYEYRGNSPVEKLAYTTPKPGVRITENGQPSAALVVRCYRCPACPICSCATSTAALWTPSGHGRRAGVDPRRRSTGRSSSVRSSASRRRRTSRPFSDSSRPRRPSACGGRRLAAAACRCEVSARHQRRLGTAARRPCERWTRRVVRRRIPHELFLSVVTLGEVRQGIEQWRGRHGLQAQALDRWLGGRVQFYEARLLHVDGAVAEQGGRRAP